MRSNSGVARVNSLPVIKTVRASIKQASPPRCKNSWVSSSDDHCSPNAVHWSSVRGVSSCNTARLCASFSSSRQSWLNILCANSREAWPRPSLKSSSAIAKWRWCKAAITANASCRLPAALFLATPSKALVTPAPAETTTRGERSRSRQTILATLRIAAASCTEVPPNFMTIIFAIFPSNRVIQLFRRKALTRKLS
ncbi:MAG: hypothetical protein ALAOOOJD_02247 [bacterium]|nr:hypothetical protein [bacterium]